MNIYDNLKKNSIGENEIHKVREVKRRKILVKTTIPLIAAFTIISLSGCGLLHNDRIVNGVKYEFNYDSMTVSNLTHLYTDDAKAKMRLANLDPNIPHTIEEYKTVDLNDDDIFGMYLYTQYDKAEIEKAIKSLGYNGWNDYLIKQNCVNEKNEGDIYLWKELHYQKLYDNVIKKGK